MYKSKRYIFNEVGKTVKIFLNPTEFLQNISENCKFFIDFRNLSSNSLKGSVKRFLSIITKIQI